MTLVPAGPTLETLAATANEEHRLCYESAMSTVMHAIKCGEALNEAYAQVGFGGWGKWVEDNLSIHYVTVKVYRRMAFYRAEVEAAGASTMAAAKLATRGLPQVPIPDKPRIDDVPSELVKHMRQLRKDGKTYREIGEQFGLSHVAVRVHIDPQARKKAAERQNQWSQRRRAARRALEEKERRQERDALAKGSSSKSSSAYATVRRLALELDAAILAAPQPAVRVALEGALVDVHHAEDKIVEALQNERIAS